jgi:hypothetical protein
MEEELFIPNQIWFTLREACKVKGLNYHTALNRKELRPNGGTPDGTIGGKRVWNRETITKWINLTDADIKTMIIVQT